MKRKREKRKGSAPRKKEKERAYRLPRIKPAVSFSECRRFLIGHAVVQIAKNPLAIAIAHAINPRAERSQRIVLERGPQGILLMKAGEREHRVASHRIAIEHPKQSTKN